MPEPDCPKCPFTPMEPFEAAPGVEADKCPKCEGLWFDSGELAEASKNPDAMRQVLMAAPLKPRDGSANCPRCLRPRNQLN